MSSAEDSNPTSSLSKEQCTKVDPEEGLQGKGGDESDMKEPKDSVTPKVDERDKNESEGNASEEKDDTLASEDAKIGTSEPMEEDQTNQEKVPSTKNTSSETNATSSEEKQRERHLSAELKKGEIKIKGGMAHDDEDSLVIDEAGDDDAKSESDKAAGSEVSKWVVKEFRTERGEKK